MTLSEIVAPADLDEYEVLRAVRNPIGYPDLHADVSLRPSEADEVAAVAERSVRAVLSWWVEERKPKG